jgi:hypothetical protein
MSTLSYDAFPLGSDLSREFTADGVTITAAAAIPSARATRLIVRAAALHAVPDCLIVVAVACLAAFIMVMQINRPPNLPPIVYPLFGVFVAAIYLLAWKLRVEAATDALHQASRQVTVISTTPAELRIETEGPFGTASHRIPAADIADIHRLPMKLKLWWEAASPMLRVTMRDARTIDVLPGRDEAELDAVAATLRKALKVPESVVKLRPR